MLDLILIIIFIGLSAFFSGSEIGFYRTSRIRLRLRSEHGWAGARILKDLTRSPRITISSILVGNNITHYVVVALSTRQLRHLGLEGADLWSTIILSPVLLVFAEILPKLIFERRADALMYRAAPVLKACEYLFYPVLAVLRVLLAGLCWLTRRGTETGRDAFTPERFRFLLHKSSARGVISSYQREMMDNIMRLRSLGVTESLVPLDEVVMVPATADVAELRRVLREHRFSRIPIYHADRDEIAGIVNVIDILADGEDGDDVRELSRTPLRISSELSVVGALYALQRAGQQMAVIRDPDGNPLGIVTVKDLVERIVGELEAW
jgi:putative hemolysin